MRVIAGIYRSRRLHAPRGLATRPTSDRLRETLFNVLAPRIEGAHFADLYAGSGAVGLEALSRGAASVTFVENAPPALEALRKNLSMLGISEGVSVEARTVSAAINTLARHSPRWDIVFLDPPYDLKDAYPGTLSTLASSAEMLLAPNAIVIAEHRRRMPIPLLSGYGVLERYRVLEQGDAALTFFALHR